MDFPFAVCSAKSIVLRESALQREIQIQNVHPWLAEDP
jgi:hypothetical protein